MRYYSVVTREGKHTLIDFPDAPGCQTFTSPGREAIEERAAEALEGWLESYLANDETPPRPAVRKPRARRGARVVEIPVSPRLTIALTLRWAREDRGMTQLQLARQVHATRAQVASLEDPDANPTLEMIERIAGGIGLRLEFVPAP